MKRVFQKYIFNLIFVIAIFVVLFSIYKTYSKYSSEASVKVEAAMPIMGVDGGEGSVTLEFISRGYIPYNFDIVNFQENATNQVDMEYFIIPIIEEENLPLQIKKICVLDEENECTDYTSLYNNDIHGYGPFPLLYDETGSDSGVRVHHEIIFTWGECESISEDENSEICNDNNDITYAAKNYRFHIDVKAIQKN